MKTKNNCFNHLQVEIQFNLNTFNNKAELFAAVDAIPYIYGSTNTADGIMTMRNMFNANDGDRDGVPNIGIVVTDGVSNINSRYSTVFGKYTFPPLVSVREITVEFGDLSLFTGNQI